MKKISEYTTRGQIGDTTVERIMLFDGRFDTAFRVTKFVVWGTDPSETASEVSAKLMTEDLGVPTAPNIFNADDNREIGWASHEIDNSLGTGNDFTVIDRDNLIVEDLFIWANNAANDPINYLIEMEKYDISDWQGALAMVRNRSQT